MHNILLTSLQMLLLLLEAFYPLLAWPTSLFILLLRCQLCLRKCFLIPFHALASESGPPAVLSKHQAHSGDFPEFDFGFLTTGNVYL